MCVSEVGWVCDCLLDLRLSTLMCDTSTFWGHISVGDFRPDYLFENVQRLFVSGMPTNVGHIFRALYCHNQQKVIMLHCCDSRHKNAMTCGMQIEADACRLVTCWCLLAIEYGSLKECVIEDQRDSVHCSVIVHWMFFFFSFDVLWFLARLGVHQRTVALSMHWIGNTT